MDTVGGMKVISTLLIITGVCVLIITLGVATNGFQGTNVVLQSSDGEWADSEVLLKGREFNQLVVLFELYKIKCQRGSAVLQRITEKPRFVNPTSWFGDESNPKWKVPFSLPHPNLEGETYYPPVSMDHCSNRGTTDNEYDIAQSRADEYLKRIKDAYKALQTDRLAAPPLVGG